MTDRRRAGAPRTGAADEIATAIGAIVPDVNAGSIPPLGGKWRERPWRPRHSPTRDNSRAMPWAGRTVRPSARPPLGKLVALWAVEIPMLPLLDVMVRDVVACWYRCRRACQCRHGVVPYFALPVAGNGLPCRRRSPAARVVGRNSDRARTVQSAEPMRTSWHGVGGSVTSVFRGSNGSWSVSSDCRSECRICQPVSMSAMHVRVVESRRPTRKHDRPSPAVDEFWRCPFAVRTSPISTCIELLHRLGRAMLTIM